MNFPSSEVHFASGSQIVRHIVLHYISTNELKPICSVAVPHFKVHGFHLDDWGKISPVSTVREQIMSSEQNRQFRLMDFLSRSEYRTVAQQSLERGNTFNIENRVGLGRWAFWMREKLGIPKKKKEKERFQEVQISVGQ
ncbi:hypothetical protein CEXT_762351 [Caerostris extrusa]|uniref:Uncharacterized protein n=1 Tax=Caerostris extrusa TaxID=172846 RepID=A0AAV4SWG0_CAEEX|nr:hypothetical protein CEXT_762351 [Caerostris extrusa]